MTVCTHVLYSFVWLAAGSCQAQATNRTWFVPSPRTTSSHREATALNHIDVCTVLHSRGNPHQRIIEQRDTIAASSRAKPRIKGWVACLHSCAQSSKLQSSPPFISYLRPLRPIDSYPIETPTLSHFQIRQHVKVPTPYCSWSRRRGWCWVLSLPVWWTAQGSREILRK